MRGGPAAAATAAPAARAGNGAARARGDATRTELIGEVVKMVTVMSIEGLNNLLCTMIDMNLLNTYPITCYLARTLSLRRFQSSNGVSGARMGRCLRKRGTTFMTTLAPPTPRPPSPCASAVCTSLQSSHLSTSQPVSGAESEPSPSEAVPELTCDWPVLRPPHHFWIAGKERWRRMAPFEWPAGRAWPPEYPIVHYDTAYDPYDGRA
eukprot:gene2417-2378_t